MCGRYVSPDEASIEREFNLVRTEWQFPPSFNVAPTQQVPVIRQIDGELQGSLLRWGLIPFFAKGEPPKYSTINARIETVETAASSRSPVKGTWRGVPLRYRRASSVRSVLRVGSRGASRQRAATSSCR
jgi:putative SOS response-associated peptidase YedK